MSVHAESPSFCQRLHQRGRWGCSQSEDTPGHVALQVWTCTSEFALRALWEQNLSFYQLCRSRVGILIRTAVEVGKDAGDFGALLQAPRAVW